MLIVRLNVHLERDAAEVGKRRPQCRIECQRHQGGAGRDDRQAELLGELIAERTGANLRNRQPSGGDNQGVSAHPAFCGAHAKAGGGGFDRFHRARLPVRHLACCAFFKQCGDELLCRVIAKQLSLVLFVKADAVLAQQRDDVSRPVSGERRFAEMRVA